jgi:hypothetical protein
VKPDYSDDQVSVAVSTEFNLGEMQLPYMNIPVNHPKLGYEIGEVQLGGKNVGIKVNLSEIAPLQSGEGRLPNGTPVPFVGENGLVEIPVGKTGDYNLRGLERRSGCTWYAIPIKPFDAIGKTVGDINLLPTFQIEM